MDVYLDRHDYRAYTLLPVHTRRTFPGFGYRLMTWGLFHKRFPFRLWWKFHFVVINFTVIRSQQILHMPRQHLPWHVQKLMTISWLDYEWKKNEIFNNVTFWWKNHLWYMFRAWMYFSQFAAISCLYEILCTAIFHRRSLDSFLFIVRLSWLEH